MKVRADQLNYFAMAAEVFTSLCCLAWSIPLILFTPFVGSEFYEPFASIMPQTYWGMWGLLVGVIGIIGFWHFIVYGTEHSLLRFYVSMTKVALWGALATVGFFSDYEVTLPYLYTAIFIVSVFGGTFSWKLGGYSESRA
jgi:hypothetical protein